ncbi:MAG: sulfotransferase [Sphingomicrobium sp.]
MVLSTPQADKSGQSPASLGLALAALRVGNIGGARQMLQDRLALHPADAHALEMLAELAAGQRSIEEATILLRRAVAADPSGPRRLALIAHLHRHAPALALDEIEQLPQATRGEFEVRAIEASVAGMLGMHDRQILLYQALARERPGQAGLWVSLGNALKTVGRTGEAVKALQRAIRADPGSGDAWWTLANFKSFKFSPGDIGRMQAALRGPISEHDALHIHFALGKAYEDRAEYERSMRHYVVGNGIRAASFGPDQVAVTEFVDESLSTVTGEFFERLEGAGCPDPGPIFVVGLHRSGSTLIEQILASHPEVEGTTELPVMRSIRDRLTRSSGKSLAAAIRDLQPADVRAIGGEYLHRSRPFRQTDRPFFVDKMPANWMTLALIRAALPNARIVDARRHPMACGFSNFKQNYASGLGFSYDLRWIGAFYRDYRSFMSHFDEVQPGVVCRALNERLIEDPEGEVRRMLDHLGLPFDRDCLEFHKNDRAVRTPSAEQVRRPLNRDGVEHWRHYEPWLGALKESLGPALDHWAD